MLTRPHTTGVCVPPQMDDTDFARLGGAEWGSLQSELGIVRAYERSASEVAASKAVSAAAAAAAAMAAGGDAGGDAASAGSAHDEGQWKSRSLLWVAAVVRGCVSQYALQALRIQRLTAGGASQLAADIGKACLHAVCPLCAVD